MVEASKRPASADASQGASKRQNTAWGWLWKNTTFSDIKIVLVADGTAQGSTGIKAETHSEVPLGHRVVLHELPAHKVVVASVSNHFRDRLVAWDAEQQAKKNAGTNGSAMGADGGVGYSGCVLEEEILPDQLPAAEAVLHFMYSQELPKNLDALHLITVTRLAERWEMEACTQACLNALSSLTPTQLPANLIGSIMADDLPRSIVDKPMYSPLLEACRQRMLQLFGSVQAVVRTESLLRAFCELPFSAVKLWARLDDLRVDNENTVAVLISHWWLHNHPTAVRSPVTTPRIGGTGSGSGQAPSMTQQGTQTSSSPVDTDPLAEQRRALSNLIRVNQLSASFFTGVLQLLPWWGPQSDLFNMLCMARALHVSKGTLLQAPIRDRLPAPWLAKGRHRDTNQETVHQWVVPKEELDQLHKDAGAGRMLRESPGLYWCGYMWHLCLSLNSQKDALWVGVRARSPVPPAYQVPVLMEAKFTIAVKEASTREYSKKETLNFGEGAALQPANCNGTPRLLGVPASSGPRTASQPPVSLMIDGKLYLQLTMENMQ